MALCRKGGRRRRRRRRRRKWCWWSTFIHIQNDTMIILIL
jgi:hypothetical protein